MNELETLTVELLFAHAMCLLADAKVVAIERNYMGVTQLLDSAIRDMDGIGELTGRPKTNRRRLAMNEEPETLAPQGPASAAPAAEPISAILAEMRDPNSGLCRWYADGGSCDCPKCAFDLLADRIEEAVKRELSRAAEDAASKATLDRTAKDAVEYMAYAMAHNSAPQPGSDAAMRAALVRILEIEGYGAPWIEAKCIAQERPKIEQPGNAAALREALEEQLRYWNAHVRSRDEEEMRKRTEAALSAPVRNCDRFVTVDEARKAFQEARGHKVLADVELWDSMDEAGALVRWLFAPMKENGGNKQ